MPCHIDLDQVRTFVCTAFAQAFFQGAIRMFQRDNEMRNIVVTDAESRDKATRHFFNRALMEARGEAGVR